MASRASSPMILAAAVALVVVGCASIGDVDRTLEMPDPVSTRDLGSNGGGSLIQISAMEMAATSESATTVRVIDVHRSQPNTPDGEFPAIDGSEGPDQLRDLQVITQVDVEIVETLGGVPLGSVGEVVTITVHGGTIATLLTPDEAAALDVEGATVVETVPEPEPGEESEPTEEPQADPDGVVQFTIGVAPTDYLTEGETVAIFTVTDTMPQFGSSTDRSIVRITHPIGIFRPNGESVFDQSQRSVDLSELARLVP